MRHSELQAGGPLHLYCQTKTPQDFEYVSETFVAARDDHREELGVIGKLQLAESSEKGERASQRKSSPIQYPCTSEVCHLDINAASEARIE